MGLLDLSTPDPAIPLRRAGWSKIFDNHLFDNFLTLRVERVVKWNIATDESHRIRERFKAAAYLSLKKIKNDT
jgi:hypothetical protein